MKTGEKQSHPEWSIVDILTYFPQVISRGFISEIPDSAVMLLRWFSVLLFSNFLKTIKYITEM